MALRSRPYTWADPPAAREGDKLLAHATTTRMLMLQ
jgi:hypothetical protein